MSLALYRRRSLNNSFSAKQRHINSRWKFKLAVITIATFTRGIHRLAITTRARNLNIWRKSVYVESYLGEGVRVTFCLRSLTTQRGSVNTGDVATERLAKSDKRSENFSFRKTADRQLGFRSHKQNRILVCIRAHCNYIIDEFTTSGKNDKTKTKNKIRAKFEFFER